MAERRAHTEIPCRAWRDPLRRGVALGAALSLHLALWLLLRPAVWELRATTDAQIRHPVLQLRLLPRAVPAQAPAVAAVPRAAQRAAQEQARRKLPLAPAVTPARVAPPVLPPVVPDTPSAFARSQPASGDGGFHQRLRQAQRAYAIHGVPGSTVPRVAGIRLIDPRNQGVGAAVRQVQRLFGIPDHHCIDVDVWRHLTPQELSARHISPDEVDRVDRQYQCNRPPGLSF